MTTVPPSRGGFVEKRGDKKRQNRIQGGGWGKQSNSGGRGRGRGASRGQGPRPGVSSKNTSPHTSAYEPWKQVEASQTQQTQADCHDVRTYPVDCKDHQQQNRTGGGQQQGHGGANTTMRWSGQPGDAGYQSFTYETPVDIVRKKKEVLEVELKNEGQTVLSESEAGPSEILFEKNFLTPEEAERIYDTLVREIRWNRRIITKPDGSTYEEPRKTFWFGELPYSYSRVTMESCKEWHPVVEDLKKKIEMNTHHTFNSVLCNFYEDAKDGVQWHSDDEYSLGSFPVIASLSLGETRKFQLRKKPYPGAKDEEDYLEMKKYFIHLGSGSLLVMRGATQDDWQHRVPKEYHDRKGRINLTFRTIQ